jgi:hypothetical protein
LSLIKERTGRMKRGYKRYLETKNKRLEAKEDTPEIIEEIKLAYMEAFADHKLWCDTKDKLHPNKSKGRPLHPEMVQDLSLYFGDAIGGFPSKFTMPLKKTKK